MPINAEEVPECFDPTSSAEDVVEVFDLLGVQADIHTPVVQGEEWFSSCRHHTGEVLEGAKWAK
ncbi:hypothetical protein CONPUDRAFT_154849 [Coniophora puteana RWD-64-598 SS2]|uniref:Uncharacterized protein n=1 Tax=Coniophora puteana (strain RWD-64-598) TaxID=741705 RepID=A0A5M3MQ69_CONPW|nr:uncharacterized protein CONPUDRAFT_154849 [Coniophora puteana RWD-64-598 SS2]EIW80864.1 hypothetical protein CONPUDRAFT_154849 [Coniophora puteana RWD-64-598 SS2]